MKFLSDCFKFSMMFSTFILELGIKFLQCVNPLWEANNVLYVPVGHMGLLVQGVIHPSFNVGMEMRDIEMGGGTKKERNFVLNGIGNVAKGLVFCLSHCVELDADTNLPGGRHEFIFEVFKEILEQKGIAKVSGG